MEYRKLSEIKLLENNPRKIDEKQFKILCKSIKDNTDYFEARPIILSDRTGELVIIAGNQRYKAAEYLKLKEVPTYLMSGLSLEKEKEIVIRDNVSNGEWDWEILNSEEWEVDLSEWGVDVPEWGVEAEPTEQKDLSDQLKETFEVIISAVDEKQQEQIYNKLIGEGYTCRVLTL